MIYDYIKSRFNDAFQGLGMEIPEDIAFDIPKQAEHGDLSTNIAMKLAKPLGKNPRALAEELIAKIEDTEGMIEFINIAGPGFINIKFNTIFFTGLLKEVNKKGHDYGKLRTGYGKRVNVEYVSVNPTGLLHLGHGRNACIGDSVSNLFEWSGYEVTREYYFNNAGNQMNMLARSIFARYMQIGQADYPFPEDGYHGDYVREIAQDLNGEYGESLTAGNEHDLQLIRKYGENWCFDKIKKTLVRLSIKQDKYFNEDTLYSDGKIAAIIEDFTKMGLAYQKEGATWLALSKMGLSDDRVIVKSSGEPTYRLPDMAYHREKFNRGYDILVDVFGSDHIATIPDVIAGLKSLGYETDKIKVLIHQFVTLTENGEQVKMSKRTGKSYTLDDLLDEVGADVVRFFLIMRGISTHLEFDLDLAREQSEKNPVYYLQYAHARISSVLDNATEKGIDNYDGANPDLLNSVYEINLIKKVLKFEEAVENATIKCEPLILADYLRELAQAFHAFYHECRIIGSEEELMKARLTLASVVKTVLANGLKILGITAPVRM
jgi:arginyl-tRNA synthetase